MKLPREIEGKAGVWQGTDRRGRPVEIRRVGAESFVSLRKFYDEFEPKGVAMGLPPSRAHWREQWLQYLLSRGCNLVASVDRRTMGHLAMVPMGDGGADAAIFVHPDVQGRGVGTLLLRAALEAARREEEWSYLTGWVQADNLPILRLLRRAGFVFCSSFEPIRELRLSLLPAGETRVA
jgi:ribosomal protein S18 acetylase RimI-like enzyme